MDNTNGYTSYRANWLFGQTITNEGIPQTKNLEEFEVNVLKNEKTSKPIEKRDIDDNTEIGPRRDTSFVPIVKKFMESTTAHGIPRVVSAASVRARLLWITIFMVAMVAFVIQTSLLVTAYLDFEVVNKISVQTKPSLQFPSVTVCNTNKLRRSAIAESIHKDMLVVDGDVILPYYSPCIAGDFACSGGLYCIKQFLVCDGVRHCKGDNSDEDGCVYGECGNDQFRCGSGSIRGPCIPKSNYCDRTINCYEGEDENDCECKSREFKCKTKGGCIPKEKYCDGFENCLDGSDERNCSGSSTCQSARSHQCKYCQLNEVQCDGFECDCGKCIPKEFRCDGYDDCTDESDETNCTSRVPTDNGQGFCAQNEFRCISGQCIVDYWKCDGDEDCGDGTDEDPNLCGTNIVQWRDDNRCGPDHPLPNGQPSECNPLGNSPCCSPYGWCGSNSEFCECFGCINYALALWRSDGRCGASFPLPNGEPAQCNPDSSTPCCSADGWCGIGPESCSCAECTDFTPRCALIKSVSTDTTYEYHFLQSTSPQTRFDFRVLASNDVHIALSSDDNPVMYEIVIGGWSNTKSVVRSSQQGDSLVEVSTPNILSNIEFRGFWITYNNGDIKVGREGQASFMECTGYNQSPVTGLGYSTGWGSAGQFRFCIHEPDEEPWREDARCGQSNLLSSGLPAECNPMGDSPCCSSSGFCGGGPLYCECSSCVDFSEGTCHQLFLSRTGTITSSNYPQLYDNGLDCTTTIDVRGGSMGKLHFEFVDFEIESHDSCDYDYIQFEDGITYRLSPKLCGVQVTSPWTSDSELVFVRFHSDSNVNHKGYKIEYTFQERIDNSTERRLWRGDGRCGPEYLLPNGNPTICDPHGPDPCCSPHGYCGADPEYCNCVGCIDYKPKRWREDGRCGPDFPQVDGTPSECDPFSIATCCSNTGYCGGGIHYCNCDGCVDYKADPWREDGRCGINFPLPNGMGITECNPQSTSPCCSESGWCGNEPNHCECPNCVDYREILNCGGVVSLVTANITSENYPLPYPIDKQCSLTIDTRIHGLGSLHFEFLDFDVEYEEYCDYDYVQFVDGLTSRHSDKFCGNQELPSWTSDSGLVHIKFQSDGSTNGKGYALTYTYNTINTTNSYHKVVTSMADTLTSPKYPDYYPDQEFCLVMIDLRDYGPGCIRFHFLDFDIEYHESCQYDYIMLADGITQRTSGRLCGQALPSDWISDSALVFLTFSSDIHTAGIGYYINYTHEGLSDSIQTDSATTDYSNNHTYQLLGNNSTSQNMFNYTNMTQNTTSPQPGNCFPCDNGTLCIPEHRFCDSVNDCVDQTDEYNCSRSNTTWGSLAWTPLSSSINATSSLQIRTSTSRCRPDEFDCGQGRCIDGYRECNTVKDCPNDSDEHDNCTHKVYLRTDVFQEGWYDGFIDLSNDPATYDDFHYNYYRDNRLERVKGEHPPDWEGFMTFSSTPDFSDLENVLKLSKSEVQQFGHQPEDFIVQCTFDNKPCNASEDFYNFQDDTYGNCYKFNHGRYNQSVLNATRTGANYGLKLTLFMEQSEYISLYGRDAGARVTITPHDVPAFPEDEGLTVRPGTVTSMGLRESIITRLPEPYGTCRDRDSEDFIFGEEYRYKVESCQKSCREKAVVERCGCSLTIHLDSVPPCSVLNKTQDLCCQLVFYLYQVKALNCDCPQPCWDKYYTQSTSQSAWPSQVYLKHLLRSLHAHHNKTRNINNMDAVSSNLASVEIYFEELSYEVISEQAAYPITKLFSDIGGTLGLYIGLSIITVFEFFEFVIEVITLCTTARVKRQTNRTERTWSLRHERT